MKKFVEDFEKLLEEYKGRVGKEDVACVMLISDGEDGYNSVQGHLGILGQMLGHLFAKDHRLSKRALTIAATLAARQAKNSDENLN